MADFNRDRTATMDKCLIAMREDLAPWISRISSSEITVETLMEDLDTGVALCRLANAIQRTGEEFLLLNCSVPRRAFPPCGVTYKERTAFRGSFIARDNVANFIRWCRELGVSDVIMFETEDLVLHKNEKSVILTLMEVARLSAKFGVEPPDLVRMENEIDQEIEQQQEEIVVEPVARLKRTKSHSLDDLVYQVLEQCTCPVRYPVLRVGEGKYRVGEGKSLIFVRVMRKHVMVRVGGGWDTLERYFDKHDPCKVTERQRRNSVKSTRSRSGSDLLGRSASSMSISSTDSHDSAGLPVSHGRTASWTGLQNSHSHAQLKSPRDPVTRVTSVSPTRSLSPASSPRLRQRRGTMSRDTPPRTIDTQSRGRLSRKSKSMQELNSVYVDGRSPSYSKPTNSSNRKQSMTGQNSPRDGASGGPEQSRRRSIATTSRKSSNVGVQGESPTARSRLSSSGPVGSQRPGPPTVSRSASFGSRPRTLIPVMEPRSKTEVSSRPAKEPQRRASSALPGRVEYRSRSRSTSWTPDAGDETKKREPSAKRRSSSAINDGKARLPGSPKLTQKSAVDKQERTRKPSASAIDGKARSPGSPKPAQRSAEDKQERTRKPSASTIDGKARSPGSPKPAQKSAEDKQERIRKTSVSKLPSPRNKPEQRALPATRKISTGSKEQGRPHRSLPSTPRERKSSTTQQNGPQSSAVTGPKTGAVKDKAKGLQTPPTSRRENKSEIQKKGLKSSKKNESVINERTMKSDQEDKKEIELGSEQTEDEVFHNEHNISVFEESTENVFNEQLNGQAYNLSEHSDVNEDVSCTRDISSPDDRLSPRPTINGRRKTSECSFETDSDVNSDLLSDLTDTDFDFRSQRYSGLSETSSDISFSTSPAWKLFHSVDLERSDPEPESSELATSPQTLRDCLMNLNLQGSVTPTMKKRIFESSQTKEDSPDFPKDFESQPVDKAIFFDIEHYNDNSPDEEEATVSSPRKWSLVKSLISSIERRSGGYSDAPRVNKNVAAVSRAAASVSADRHGMDESAVITQTSMSNHKVPRARSPPTDELTKEDNVENTEVGTDHCIPTPDGVPSTPRDHVVYDVNKNISNSRPRESDGASPTNSRKIPGEKPFESSESVNHGAKTKKTSRETKRKDKDMDVFPRPQRQFTLEEMIQDMLPAEGESTETGDQRVLSPEPRFQAWL